ncbi:Nn.00g081870.m01.CDS01 [Neocucurbitaria sp. VM-36]
MNGQSSLAIDEKEDVNVDLETQQYPAWSDDIRNPQNWNVWKKLFHTFVPCALAFEITFSTSVTVPATDLIAAHFSVSRTESILTLTLYTIGLALGPMFIAPLSEVIGRKWIYIITVTCLLAFSGASGGAQSFATFLVCRFLAGMLGSAGIAIGAGTLADVWSLGKEGGIAGLFFILGPFLGPTFGPLAGAYILANHDNNWRWCQWLIVLTGTPIWIGVILMNETSHQQIKERLEHPAIASRKEVALKVVASLSRAAKRPIRMLFTETIVLSLSVYTAFAYAMIFSYFASSSYILAFYYDFDQRQIGLSFISIVIGYLLAAMVFGVFDKTLFAKACQKAENGVAAPEHRLYAALVGSIFLPIGLFWYAWEAHRGGSWAALVASGIPFGLGAFSLFLSTITYLVDVYQAEAAASALAANGVLRYALGATFPLFTLPMYQSLGVHWAGTIFACLSVLLLPIPWLLFKFGHLLRPKAD